jgi:short-subunit dehydrogenase
MKQYNKITPEDLDKMLDLNLKGSFYTCQAAANVMKENKYGHICNVVGILGKHSMAMAAAYCASKYGVVGFSKCLADELKRYGIKMTLFYFGGVDTPFWDQVSLKVDRNKMLTAQTAADAIYFAMNAEPQAVPMEINIQPDSLSVGFIMPYLRVIIGFHHMWQWTWPMKIGNALRRRPALKNDKGEYN